MTRNCLRNLHYSIKKIKYIPYRSIIEEILRNENNIFFIDEIGFNVCNAKNGLYCLHKKFKFSLQR